MLVIDYLQEVFGGDVDVFRRGRGRVGDRVLEFAERVGALVGEPGARGPRGAGQGGLTVETGALVPTERLARLGTRRHRHR